MCKPDGSIWRVRGDKANSKLDAIDNARIKARNVIAEYKRACVTVGSITICQLAEMLVKRKYEKNLIKEATAIRHLETVKKLETFKTCQKPLVEVTPYDIEALYVKIKNYSNSYIRKICQMINSAFDYALDQEWIIKNPCKGVDIPKSTKPNKKIRAFTIEEHQALIKELDACKFATQLKLSLLTGMRMGEINALSVNDIDLEHRTINVHKTVSKSATGSLVISNQPKTYAGNRTVLITDSILPIIENCVNAVSDNGENALLFTNSKGQVLSTGAVNDAFKKFYKKINPAADVNQHMLRHTFATRCIEAGMQPKVLQKIMGHEDISTTMNTYVDAFSAYEKENMTITEAYLQKQKLV